MRIGAEGLAQDRPGVPVSGRSLCRCGTLAAVFALSTAGGAPTVFNTPQNQADHIVFDVSLPIADEMMPFVNYIASLPAAEIRMTRKAAA